MTLVEDNWGDGDPYTTMAWYPPDYDDIPPGPVMTPALVVTHLADDGAGWDAWIAGRREAVRVAGPGELNELLGELGITATTLAGFRPCDAPRCHLAATTAALTVTGDAWLIARACDAHKPDAVPGAAFVLIPGPVAGRSSYQRHRPADIAAIVGVLLAWDVPPSLLAQPECAACGQRIAMAGNLAWYAAASTVACPGHAPAPGPVADLLTAWAQGAVPVAAPPRAVA
jgi:hypothetical protein